MLMQMNDKFVDVDRLLYSYTGRPTGMVLIDGKVIFFHDNTKLRLAECSWDFMPCKWPCKYSHFVNMFNALKAIDEL